MSTLLSWLSMGMLSLYMLTFVYGSIALILSLL